MERKLLIFNFKCGRFMWILLILQLFHCRLNRAIDILYARRVVVLNHVYVV